MSNILRRARILGILLLFAPLMGCISSKPVENSSVIDDRPVLFFNFENKKPPSSPVKIYVNDLYMGDAQNYLEGEQGLLVISGTHILKLQYQGEVIAEKKIYLGKGSGKTVPINLNLDGGK
jgi:hypothetical protein